MSALQSLQSAWLLLLSLSWKHILKVQQDWRVVKYLLCLRNITLTLLGFKATLQSFTSSRGITEQFCLDIGTLPLLYVSSGNNLIEKFTKYSLITIIAVSYTHLDVYKRQYKSLVKKK